MAEQSPIWPGSRSLQPCSPLFKLPRELRDLIYEFYAYDKNIGRALNLAYTCKAAAAELPSVLLRANKIAFTPAYSDPEN